MSGVEVPIAWVLDVERRPSGLFLLRVLCPLCGDAHTHGGGEDESELLSGLPLGHRSQHCQYPDCREGPGYDVQVASAETQHLLEGAFDGRCRGFTAKGRRCRMRVHPAKRRALCENHAWKRRDWDGWFDDRVWPWSPFDPTGVLLAEDVSVEMSGLLKGARSL